MAQISVVSTTSTSITVQLTGLDSSYSQSLRSCYWYIGSSSSPKASQGLQNKISSSPSVTLSGLSPDTSYTVKAVITNITGSSDVTLTKTVWTDEAPITADYDISSYTSSSVTVKIYGLSSGQNVTWYVRLYSNSSNFYSDNFTASSSTHYRSCTGLSPNTKYVCNVSVNGTLLGQQTFWTEEETIDAEYDISSHTSTSVTVKIYSLVSGQNVTWYVRLYSDTSNFYSDNFTASSSTHYRSCTGLTPNTRYVCNVSVNGTLLGQQSFWTDSETINIDLWDWNVSNGSNASVQQTKNAYTAITTKGSILNFSYTVWNDMVDKVKEILDETSSSWNSTYATYANTKMTSSNKTMTATRFNSLKYNIDLHSSTGIATQSSGNIIYGSYFVTLANRINTWINAI